MSDTLRDLVRCHSERHADAAGVSHTPIAGLRTIRATRPSALEHAISRPLACLVLQGTKRVTTGNRTVTFGAGQSLLITADVPTVSQILEASSTTPYMSLVFDLNLATLAELAMEMKASQVGSGDPVQTEPTDRDVADAAARLMQLLNRPAALEILQAQLVREMHYWLLAGKHGPTIRRLAWPDGHVQRLARAVALLRTEYAQPLPLDRLASEAGMSRSSFHQHFRAMTSLSPLQFQKQLRLIEARRRMLSEGASASTAAFDVGYESLSQFTRDYRRMFGLPPRTETSAAKTAAAAC